MTQAYNLSQLANNLNTAGQLDATDGLVNAVPAANGGTGQSTYAVGDLLYASGATALAKLPDVATGNVLISGGVGAAPSYGKVGLTTHVNGTLPIANGGTNSTATPTAGGVIYGNGTAHAITAAGTSGQVLTSAGTGSPTWSTISGSQTVATVFDTAGSNQTFTVPSGVTKVKVTIIGGGGTGSAGSTTGGQNPIDYYGSGGGGGGTAIKWLSGLTPGGTLTVAVGAAGGTSSVASGTSNTITTILASGGSVINGGTGTNGSLNIAGGSGYGGSTIPSYGGGSFMATTSTGSGKNYGGGGAGGYGSGGAGLAGASGLVLFEY